MKHPNRFIQSEIEEAARTMAWLQTKRPQPVKWIVDEKRKIRIPAAWYAISELAPANGITAGRREAWQGKTRAWHAFVVAKKGHGKFASGRIGAGSSNFTSAQIGADSIDNRKLALCFAYRNAIRQLLPQEPTEQAAWQGKKEDMLASELRGQGLTKAESQQQAALIYK